jgi:nitroimidazol reductase NimA-like FMN-containing flavoprotein (pyridoxamine 5'-phosphate oxidase superfamily)
MSLERQMVDPVPAAPAALAPTERTRVRRIPKRAAYDRETVYAILDAGLVAHVAFVAGGEPVVLPMAYARVGDEIVLHGSTRARMLALIEGGAPVCVTVTLLDALVLARSAFHHSVNYRSVAVFGRPRLLEGDEEKSAALAAFTEKLMPGRWQAVRPPNETELRVTAVATLRIEEASAKVRDGGPIDDAEDLGLPVWAGYLPLSLVAGEPIADAVLDPAIAVPEHVTRAGEELRRRSAPRLRSGA